MGVDKRGWFWGDTPAWVPLAPGGTLPPARSQFAATYSVSTNRLSIFAGDNAPVCCNLLNDVWVLPDANGIAQTTSYRDVILADNPIMYWRLGETSGTIAYDESANHRDASYINNPLLGFPGAIANDTNTSVGFNGFNQWVGWIPTSSYFGAFTVEAWVKEKQIRPVETFFDTRTKTGEFSFDFKLDISRRERDPLRRGRWYQVAIDQQRALRLQAERLVLRRGRGH